MSNHVKAMTEIFNELAVIGAAMEDEDKVVTLLASLPEAYKMLVTALEASTEVPQMEVVIERLLYEEKKLGEREKSPIPSRRVTVWWHQIIKVTRNSLNVITVENWGILDVFAKI